MINLELISSRQKELGISDKNMASFMGFSSPSTWYKYRSGSYVIKAEMLPILQRTLKVKNIESFFTQNSSKTEL